MCVCVCVLKALVILMPCGDGIVSAHALFRGEQKPIFATTRKTAIQLPAISLTRLGSGADESNRNIECRSLTDHHHWSRFEQEYPLFNCLRRQDGTVGRTFFHFLHTFHWDGSGQRYHKPKTILHFSSQRWNIELFPWLSTTTSQAVATLLLVASRWPWSSSTEHNRQIRRTFWLRILPADRAHTNGHKKMLTLSAFFRRKMSAATVELNFIFSARSAATSSSIACWPCDNLNRIGQIKHVCFMQTLNSVWLTFSPTLRLVGVLAFSAAA